MTNKKQNLNPKNKNGKIHPSQQEIKTRKTTETDQMGAFLDSAKDIWQDPKSASW